MQAFPPKLLRAYVIVLFPLLLNLVCEQAVGPAPPTPVPVPPVSPPVHCFTRTGRFPVIAEPNPDVRRRTLSPIRQVTWSFRVGCPRSTQVYTFGVRQGVGNTFELAPPPPVHAPPLVFIPSPDPFRFDIQGPIHQFWCASATVELMDGTMLTAAEWWVNESRNPAHEIKLAVSREHDVDRAVGWTADPGPCPFP